MKLVPAGDSDAERLKRFFESSTLPGAVDFSIRRPLSFFDQYRLLSDDFETLMLTDDDGSIAGMASLIFREGHVLDEKQTWAFATDLRIAPTRKAIAQWAQYFIPVLDRLQKERGCRYLFSALEQHDNQAYNALIRPTSHTRRRMPRYLLANHFHVVNLHGRFPFSSKPLQSIRLKTLEYSDLEEVCAYLRGQAKLRPLATYYLPETFMKDLGRWPNLKLSDFRVARDAMEKIRGFAALYDGKPVQSHVPLQYHGFANTIHQSLWLSSFTGLVRPFAQVDQEMPVQFLTHLHCDSAEVFHRLADDAFSRLGSRELLTYIHFRGNWRTLPPRSFVATHLPFGLYLILPPTSEAPPWPMPSIRSLPPEFEAAWL